ncbi:hypothetical protein B0O99DRAFT_626451 [Bisporella sp. PMI_857]|nr:hypothetical protein B0O99DRAFT_626451 [Bisporella sp. PMI_857]
MSEAPEYHTKTLSPLSPLPQYSAKPSTIPVLRNQIDPVFNMTSTHMESHHPDVATSSNQIPPTLPSANPDDDDAASISDSSFSDAYKEQPESKNTFEAQGNKETVETSSVSEDDYDMAADSDAEDQRSIAVGSQFNVGQDPIALPPNSHISRDDHVDVEATRSTHSPQQPASSNSPSQQLQDASHQVQGETAQPRLHTYEQIANGEVDIQALLDNITANAEKIETPSSAITPTSTISTKSSLPPKPSVGLPAHASLPPRPQVPTPGFIKHDAAPGHHSAQATNTASRNTYNPPAGVSVPYAPAPGTHASGRGNLPPPPGLLTTLKSESSAASPMQLPPPPGVSIKPDYPNSASAYSTGFNSKLEQARPNSATSNRSSSDEKWPPEIQKKYNIFLEDEQKFIADQTWESYPAGSRLYIGNLNGSTVTKRDIFHVFHGYGHIVQISVKPNYGFVQFDDAKSCFDAVKNEQGTLIKESFIQLQVSKTKTKNKSQSDSRNRRSPSPRHGGRRGRFDSGPVRDEYGRPLLDGHRRDRSPSPARGHFRGREDHGSRNFGDFYGGRDRRRSQSPPPYRERSDRDYRHRSPSPRRADLRQYASPIDSSSIPRRDANDVPDIQLYLMSHLDRDYVAWVDNALRTKGLKTNVTIYDQRLSEEEMIRQQVLEGIHAVSKLNMHSQHTGKMSVKIFKRQTYSEEVSFEDYENLDPDIVAQLVIRAKEQSRAAYTNQPSNSYSGIPPDQQYSGPQGYQQSSGPNFQQSHQRPSVPNLQSAAATYAQAPAQSNAAPDLGQLVGQLDNDSLQKLLSSLASQPQQSNGQQPNILHGAFQHSPPAATANSEVDLAGVLSRLTAPQQYQAPPIATPYANPPAAAPYIPASATYATPAPPYSQYNANSAQSQAQPQSQGQDVVNQVQNIMAAFAKYRQ